MLCSYSNFKNLRVYNYFPEKYLGILFSALQIPRVFDRLERISLNTADERLHRLVRYVRRTWIESDKWHPSTWLVYPSHFIFNHSPYMINKTYKRGECP
jgi:hypothetical protein